MNVTPGTIYRASWGYDQTNIDFYQVVSLTPSGKYANLMTVGKRTIKDDGGPSTLVVPLVVFGEYDMHLISKADTFRRKIQDGGGRAAFAISSYSYAFEWDGNPCHETGAGWGH